jgi:hypothetical protein
VYRQAFLATFARSPAIFFRSLVIFANVGHNHNRRTINRTIPKYFQVIFKRAARAVLNGRVFSHSSCASMLPIEHGYEGFQAGFKVT